MTLIDVQGLRKSYGTREILHGIDLNVAEREVVGILGPNGAGKTTLVECLGGLRVPDGGRASVAGLDPRKDATALRTMLGIQLQQCRLPGKITPAEALELFGSFYADPHPAADLLERFGLAQQRDQRFEKLSGGQQQRLSVALALVGRPRIAILDELTTGLDPAARREIWTYLDGLVDEGTTILLVTHSLEEAEALCDRLIILADGRIVSEGTPASLSGGGEQRVSFRPSASLPTDVLDRLPGVRSVEIEGNRVTVVGDVDVPQRVLAALTDHGITAQALRVTGSSLDDAYLRAIAGADQNESVA